MGNLALDKLKIHFAQSNKAEGKSPKTMEWYSENLKGFIKFINNDSDHATLDDFNIQAVRDFIVHEQQRGLSPYSIQGRVRALKAFSSWLFRENYIVQNTMSGIKLPKVPITIIEPLTPVEIDKLLGCQNPLTALGLRNIAILVLFLDTGIRLSELCNLRTQDTHIEEGYLKVLGKGNKERIVPLGSSAQKILWRYTIHFRPEPFTENDDYLFLTLDGTSLRPNAVKLLIKRWSKKAEIPRLHPHLCRHNFATNYLIHNCGDVFRLQQILGHTSLEMVRRYVHYASSQSLITGKVLSPVDHMALTKLRGYKVDRALNSVKRKQEHYSKRS